MRRLRHRLRGLLDRMKGSMWVTPALVVLGSIALSYLAEWLDALIDGDASGWYLFRGGPEGARSVLETIAGSMMTFTGLVFSVTILVLQLASTQYSPRALKAFLEDTPSKLTLGTFVGTFVYALMTLRTVRGTSEEIDVAAYVPSLSIWVAILLLFVSVGAFIAYINHVAQSIRPTVLVRRIADRARGSIGELYPEGIGEDVGDPHPELPRGPPDLIIVNRHPSGVLGRVDEKSLMDAASEGPYYLRLLPVPGDFVLQGAPLFEVWGRVSRIPADKLVAAVTIGRDRNLAQDAAFGVRELVDVALRALSPSTNDPTTAVAALDQIHDLLRKLVRRRFPSPLREAEGAGAGAAVLLPRPSFDDYVRLALDEVRLSGGGQFQVTRRLHAMLDDLLQIAPPFRRQELMRQKLLLERGVERDFEEERDRPFASQADAKGH